MLAHTCRAFVRLAQLMLGTGKKYVLLGWFTTDMLKKYFSKLRQGSGGTYFINAQSVLEKARIHHAKLALRLSLDFESQDYTFCNRDLTTQEVEFLDNLFSLKEHFSSDTLNEIVYIGGYLETKLAKTTEDTS